MSLRLRLLNRWLRAVEKPRLARAEPLVLRRRFERTAWLLFRPPRGTRIRRDEIAGVATLRLSAPGVAADAERLLYVHGGAFVMGSSRTHAGLAARLSARLGVEVLLPDYALAPEHPYPAGLDQLQRVWTASDATLLGGDSAGGQLALSLLARLCGPGGQGRQPRATFAFSPIADFGEGGASRTSNAALDPLLPIARLEELRQLYLGATAPGAPGLSPLAAGFRGAGPVWLCAGTTEVLYDDMVAMAARLSADGVAVATHVVPAAPHVWPYFPWLPESAATLDALALWLSRPPRAPGDS